MKYMTAFLIAAMMMISGCGTEDTNVPVNSDSENTENKPDKDENGETTYLPEGFNFETRSVKLNSGYEMPIIGIGTYLLTNAQAEESVYNALKVGMRLIDTADIYGNEVGVGRGIRRAMNDFGIKREDIFVTSKLWTFLTFNNGKNVYLSGDTSTTDQMRDGTMAEKKLDYAFLCTDGYYNMDNLEAAKAAELINAVHTVPYHNSIANDGYNFNDEYAEQFNVRGKLIIKPGESIIMD